MAVRIFIETTWKAPAKGDGISMWLVEYMKDGAPVTRQGFIHVPEGTESQGTLMGLINAFHVLKKPCSALVFTQCEHVLNAVQYQWHIRWQKDGWINAKGRPVKNVDLWKMLAEKTTQHVYRVQKGFHDYQELMRLEAAKELEAWRKKTGVLRGGRK